MTTRLALLERLEERAGLRPDAPAIIETEGRTVTRGELAARAGAFARGFVEGGLLPGDRALFAVRPSATAVALVIGIAEAGGVLVPASAGIGDRLFDEQMKAVAPRWVVAETGFIAAGHSALVRRAIARLGGAVPSLRSLRGARFVRVGPPVPWGPATTSLALVERAGTRTSGATVLPRPGAELPAVIVFTSGTTAAPKGVEHSHGGLRATLNIVGEQLAVEEGDTLYAHDLHLVLPALLAGARVILSRRTRFSPALTIRDLERHRASHMFGVTGHIQLLLDHLAPSGRRLPATLRHVLVGAAPVRANFLSRLRDVLPAGARAQCVYGMTEMLPVASVSLEDKLAYAGEGDLVGAPSPGVAARVSEAGELMLHGPHLYTRYVGGPAVIEHATGDLARLDDGRIVLLGRSKDMIIRREHNIYPEIHEPIIEAIAGVRRCAMVGVYDDVAADERVVLVVEPEAWDDEDAFIVRLRRELRDGSSRIDLAAQPDLIMLLPLPESGRSRKVDKQALRELARSRLQCASR